MKFTPLMGAILAATMLSPVASMAEDGGRAERHAERFSEMDANGDGTFTREEALALAASHFDDADADNSGDLTEDEMVALHRARRDERRASRDESRHSGRHEGREARHEGRREGRHERRFERRAGDDGLINLAEFNEGALHRFERADLDENGSVTATEMSLVMRARHRGRHDRDSDDE